MASILDLLNTQTGEQLVNKASSITSEDKNKVSSALGMALPLILGAMKQKTNDPKEAESLNNALRSEKHNGDILSKLGDTSPSELTGEGSKILNHVLGSKQGGASKAIAGALNMKDSSVSNILEMAAPVVMGLLGQQKRKDNVEASGLTGLLGSVLGSNDSHNQSLIESLLDADGDGSIIDDVAGKLLGNKKGGSFLGGMFGGK